MVDNDEMNVVIQTALDAYQAGIDQDPRLTTALFELMSEYVALRLRVTIKTGQLLFSARLALVRIGKALDDSS